MSQNNKELFDSEAYQQPEEKFEPVSAKELEKVTKQQIKDFSDLLESLNKSLDKKKRLWKQIYENAVTDRKVAYLVFSDLYVQVHGEKNEHAIHGATLSKYIERMAKATDQLLKLAELVAAAEEKAPSEEGDNMSEDDVYSAIEAKRNN